MIDMTGLELIPYVAGVFFVGLWIGHLLTLQRVHRLELTLDYQIDQTKMYKRLWQSLKSEVEHANQ